MTGKTTFDWKSCAIIRDFHFGRREGHRYTPNPATYGQTNLLLERIGQDTTAYDVEIIEA